MDFSALNNQFDSLVSLGGKLTNHCEEYLSKKTTEVNEKLGEYLGKCGQSQETRDEACEVVKKRAEELVSKVREQEAWLLEQLSCSAGDGEECGNEGAKLHSDVQHVLNEFCQMFICKEMTPDKEHSLDEVLQLSLTNSLLSTCFDQCKPNAGNGRPEVEAEGFEANSLRTLRYKFSNVSSWEVKESNYSPFHNFYSGSYNWKLLAQKRLEDDKQWLGLFLECEPFDSSEDWSVKVKYEIKLIGLQTDQPALSYGEWTNTFSNEEKFNAWGKRDFIAWEDVLDPTKGYIEDDCITFEAAFRVLPSEEQ